MDKRPYAPVTTDKLYHIASTTLDEAVYEGVVAELYHRDPLALPAQKCILPKQMVRGRK